MRSLYVYLPMLGIFGVVLGNNAVANTANETITIRPENPTTDQEVIATIKGCHLVNFTIVAKQSVITITDDNNFSNTKIATCPDNSTVDVSLGKLKAGEYTVSHQEFVIPTKPAVTVFASGNFTVTESNQSPPPDISSQFDIVIEPETPTTQDDVSVTINSCGLINHDITLFGVGNSTPKKQRIIIRSDKTDVTLRDDPRSSFCSADDTVDIALGKLRAGQYSIGHTFSQGSSGTFVNGVYADTSFTVFDATSGLPIGDAYHESPAQNSIQTGIGLISGWACNAGKVEFSIDDGQKERVPYGGSRGDTKEVCVNEGFNGYGTVMAWGLLSAGEHSLQTFVDDIEISDVTFTVVKVDDGFLKREGAEYTLTDFPETGQQVRVQWRDAIQNFTIISNPESVQ